MKVEYEPYWQSFIYPIARKIGNRDSVPLRIKVGQLLISCFRVVIKFEWGGEKKQWKSLVCPQVSLIFEFALGHIRSKEWGCIPHYNQDFKKNSKQVKIFSEEVENLIQTKKLVLLFFHSLSPIALFSNTNNPCECSLEQTQWEGKRINWQGKWTLLMFKGKKITSAEGFSNMLRHNHLLFRSALVWCISPSRAVGAVQKYKLCQIISKLWYMEIGLLRIRWVKWKKCDSPSCEICHLDHIQDYSNMLLWELRLFVNLDLNSQSTEK